MINAGENKQPRAGRYILQPAGYRAFIPAPLPPDPPVDLAGPLRELLSEADYALGRLVQDGRLVRRGTRKGTYYVMSGGNKI